MAEAWNKNENLLTVLNRRVSFAMLQSICSFSRVFFFNENIMVLFCSSQRTNEVHISPETFSEFIIFLVETLKVGVSVAKHFNRSL